MAKRKAGLQIDYDHLHKTLDAIGRVALPFAAAYTLNQAAFDAQRALTAAVNDENVFDKPTKFTQNAFIVKLANPKHGRDMASVVQAKRIQAAYLHFQIEGGPRNKDNGPGGGPIDVIAYGIRSTKYGGIAKGLTKALSVEYKQEKRRRAAYGALRNVEKAKRKSRSLIDAGITDAQWGVLAEAKQMQRRDPRTGRFLKVDNEHYKKLRKLAVKQAKERAKAMREANPLLRKREATFERDVGPGIFFGKVMGSKGYWRRPADRSGKLVPLALFKDEVQYKPRFNYVGIIERAYDIRASREDFARALEREVRFQISKSSQTLTPKQAQARTFGPYLPGSRTPYGIAKYSETVRRPDFLKNTPSPWNPKLEFVK